MMTRRILSGVCVLFAAAAGLSGCKPDVTRGVLFIGDSLVVNSVTYIHADLNEVKNDVPDGRYIPSFDGVGGIGARTIPEGNDPQTYWNAHLASIVTHVNPEVYVIELGTNDCGTHNFSQYGDSIDFFLSRLPASKPVFWVNLTDQKPEDATCIQTIDDALTNATARWSNLKVLDARSALTDPSYFASDHVHYTDAGNSAWARFLHQSLDAAFVPSTTTTSTSTTSTSTSTTTTSTTTVPATTTTTGP
jgi:hypothetical protein